MPYPPSFILNSTQGAHPTHGEKVCCNLTLYITGSWATLFSLFFFFLQVSFLHYKPNRMKLSSKICVNKQSCVLDNCVCVCVWITENSFHSNAESNFQFCLQAPDFISPSLLKPVLGLWHKSHKAHYLHIMPRLSVHPECSNSNSILVPFLTSFTNTPLIRFLICHLTY